MRSEFIAEVCHEANRAYCEAMGDTSQRPWDMAAEWQRQSAIKGVAYRLKNPDASPEDQHQAWLADKLADGWVYGETKDEDKKTHPCCVPYAELPAAQRAKDYIFAAIVKTMAPKTLV